MEVVFAIGLFAAGAGTIVASLNAAGRGVRDLRLAATGEDLAVTLASELQMGFYDIQETEWEFFEEPFEQWMWRLGVEEVTDQPSADAPPMTRVTVHILHDPTGYQYRETHWLASPDADPLGEGDYGQQDTYYPDDGGYQP